MVSLRRRALLMMPLALPALLSFPEVLGQEQSVLRIATPSDPVNGLLDPHREVSIAMERYIYNVFDSLIEIDYLDGWKLKPALATSWQWTDDLTLELVLREGVRFHNGDLMSADDVVFSLSPDRILAEDWPGAGAMKSLWSNIESIEAVDALTVRVRAKTTDPQLEYRLASNGSQIISKSAFESAGSLDEWGRKPVGTGPFMVSDFRPGEVATFERFADYWGLPADVERLVWNVVPEIAARIAGLVSGEFDLITNVDPDQIGVLEARDNVKVVGGPIANLHILIFDTRNRWLSDLRIRRALSLAVDRKAIVQSLWGGRTSVPNGYQFEEYGPLYFPDQSEIAFDPAEAARLVSEAGYDGETIPFNITNNYYTTEVPRAEAMVAMWQAVGLNVAITIHEDFSNLNGGLRNGATRLSYPDPVGAIVRTWGPESFWDKEGVMTSIPPTAVDEFFGACRAISSTLDLELRKQKAREIVAWFDEHLAAVPLHREAAFYGLRADVSWQPSTAAAMQFRPPALNIG